MAGKVAQALQTDRPRRKQLIEEVLIAKVLIVPPVQTAQVARAPGIVQLVRTVQVLQVPEELQMSQA